jgi:PAS domain S-box-containing protein
MDKIIALTRPFLRLDKGSDFRTHLRRLYYFLFTGLIVAVCLGAILYSIRTEFIALIAVPSLILFYCVDTLHYQNNEKRLMAIFQCSPNSIIVYNKHGHPQALNRAFTEVFGWTLDELKGQNIPFVPDEEKEIAGKKIKEIYRTGLPVSFKTRRLTKKGSMRDVIVSAAIVKGRDKAPCEMVVNITDVTENKKIEARLQQAYKMEAIGTLAGGIAHDFNNILAAITGFCELAMMRSEKGSDQHTDLLQILKSTDRAVALVKQILTFGRQHQEELKPIQISSVVKEAIKLLKATLPATVEIHTDIQSHPDPVLADPTSIHQVIMNLCTNAAHAMQDSGGRLEVRLQPVAPGAFSASGHPDLLSCSWLNLSVKDTGHGMTPEIMQSIFDPYFTTKAQGKGTGLGLSVVHGIVKKSRGEIRVESQKGKGTTINIFWPQIKRSLQPQPAKVKPLVTGSESILIVDDEPELTGIVQRKLGQLGYRVTTRTSSIEAKELFEMRSEEFDLVLTDMTMPHMTGVELARQMMAIRPDIPIILCTGYSSQISEESAKAMGINEFIMKPISWQELAATVRKALDENGQG